MPSFSREQLESREAPGREPGQGLSYLKSSIYQALFVYQGSSNAE